MSTPSRPRALSRTDKTVNHLAALCAATDIALDEIAPDAMAMIRSNGVDRKTLTDFAADLVKYKMLGRRYCRIGMRDGKLVAMPLA